MATRCSNVVLKPTPEFLQDFLYTTDRMREVATEFTRFLLMGIREAYFADIPELFPEFAFPAAMPDTHRTLIVEFCRGIFDSPSKGDISNHAMPFLCRPNATWDRDWGEVGKKRSKTYNPEKEQWKNDGLQLLNLGLLPVVDCPAINLNAQHARNFALSTLYSVISRLDSTRKAMQRWAAERNKLLAELDETTNELATLVAERATFEAALTTAVETGFVQVNGRLLKNWRSYHGRENRCHDCYRELFDSLHAANLDDVAESFFDELVLKADLENLRVPAPRLPGIDLPVDLHLGLSTSIYIQPSLEHVDVKKPARVRKRDVYRAFLFSVPLISPNGEERIHRVESLYSGYFENLTVIRGEKGVKLQFAKNARCAPWSAVVKEFDIGLSQDGDVVARISHNITVDDEQAKRSQQIADYFSGLRPNASFPSDAIKVGDRVVSIDMGINPLFAWAVCEYSISRPTGDEVFEVDGGGFVRCIENKSFFRRFSKDEKLVNEFSETIRVGRQVLAYYKRLFIGKVVADRWVPDDQLKRLGLQTDSDAVEVREALAAYISTLRRTFRRLKDQRPGHSTACGAQYSWTQAVGEFISLIKAWSRKNRDPKEKGRTYQDRDFQTFHQYQSNLRKDLCRKIADEIVQIAERHQARVVVFERLFGFRPSQTRERSNNRLLANWARAQTIEAVKLALESRSIAYAEVDPRHTSQKDPVTGSWGYRDREYKTVLYIRRNGAVERRHADSYAAVLNLQRRFWNRNSDLSYLKAVETLCGAWVPKDVTKTLERACQRHFRLPRLVLTPHGESSFTVSGISEREYQQLLSTRRRGRKDGSFYCHGTNWLNSEKHYEVTSLLKTEFHASRRGSDDLNVNPDEFDDLNELTKNGT